MRKITIILYSIALVLLSTPMAIAQSKLPKSVCDSVCVALRRITLKEVAGSYVKVESIRLKDRGNAQVIEVRTSVELAYYPMRPDNITELYDAVRKMLPEKYRKYTIVIYSNGKLIDNLIGLGIDFKYAVLV